MKLFYKFVSDSNLLSGKCKSVINEPDC